MSSGHSSGPSSEAAKKPAFGAFRAQYDKRVAEPEAKAREVSVVNTEVVPDALRGAEDRANVLYPQYLAVDSSKKFPLDVIHSGEHSYRKRDIPSFKTESGREVNAPWPVKLYVISFLGEVSASLGYPLLKWEKEAFKVGNEYVNPKDVEVQYFPCTQRPFVRIKIYLERKSQGKDRVVFWDCHARCLTRSADNVGISFGLGADGVDMIPADERDELLKTVTAENVWVTELEAGDSSRTDVEKPCWSGISNTDVEELADKVEQDPNSVKDPKERLIGFLARAGKVVFATEINQAMHKSLPAFEQFVRTVTYVTGHMGPFWYYQLAIGNNGSIHDLNYPFDEVPPPRWLCKKWQIKYLDDTPVEMDAVQWEQYPEVDRLTYPDQRTFAFESRLAVAREQLRASIQLGLLQNLPNVLAEFHPNEDGSSYIVTMKTGGPKGDKTILPEPGRKCEIGVIYDKKTIRFNAFVMDDVLHQGASITASAKPVNPKSPRIDDGRQHNVSLSFPEDRTSTNRMSNSVSRMAAGQSSRQGPYLPGFALGAPVPKGQKPDWLHRQIAKDPAKLKIYTDELKKHKLNVKQYAAAMACIDPGPGGYLIWGPPGTGKTHGGIAIVMALIKCGYKVLVTAPGNGAVNSAIAKFTKALPADDLSFCRFAGALVNVSTRPDAKKDSDGDDEMIDDAPIDSAVTEDAGPKLDWSEDSENAAEREFQVQLADAFEMVAVEASTASKGAETYGFASKKSRWIRLLLESKPKKTDFSGKGKDKEFKAAETKHSNAQKYFELLTALKTADLGKFQLRETRTEFRLLDEWFSGQMLKEKMQVVFTTNSTASHPLLQDYFCPQILFHDEAAQASPPDTMTPLATFKEDLKFIILAGDPKQLKPVVISGSANEGSYTLMNSLFAKYVEAPELGWKFTMFTEQYRMHQDIAEFPNEHLYQGLLQTHPDCNNETELDKTVIDLLSPLKEHGDKGNPLWNGRRRIVVDISGAKVQSELFEGTPSSFNKDEAVWVADTVIGLVTSGIDASKIIVLSWYQGQRRYINSLLWSAVAKGVNSDAKNVRVLSTDTSQGDEAEIVIMSMVSNDPEDPQNVGFIVHQPRINVGITRAMRFLFVCGNTRGWVQSIMSGKGFIGSSQQKESHYFRELWKDAQSKGDIIALSDWKEVLENGSPVHQRTFYRGLKPIAPKAVRRAKKDEADEVSFKKNRFGSLKQDPSMLNLGDRLNLQDSGNSSKRQKVSRGGGQANSGGQARGGPSNSGSRPASNSGGNKTSGGGSTGGKAHRGGGAGRGRGRGGKA